MRIGLHDCEGNGYPNLALMKLSAWHKGRGDSVEWFNELSASLYDKVYSSKVFTWTKTDVFLPECTEHGGSGNDINVMLPQEIEHMCPDYSLYGTGKSYGFLTRGCSRSCKWCIVPDKEGGIRGNADFSQFVRHKEVVLMDNNVLACEHGIRQIEKMSEEKILIDFNQGLDARLIDNAMAKLLGKLKWKPSVRLACDSMGMVEPVRKAVELLRWHNTTPSQYSCYVLVKDIESALERVRFLKGIYVYPFCQPYRSPDGADPTKKQKHFSRWVNHRATFRSVTWEEYKYK
jgi:hypothetical protein